MTPVDFGVLFLNAGTGCLPRLLVAVRSLRKHYSGSAAIYSIGPDSHKMVKPICDKYAMTLIGRDYVVPDGNNRILLEKVKLLETSPFEQTLYIDSDTLILKSLDAGIEEMSRLSQGFAVPQFSRWKTGQGIIRRRLASFKSAKAAPLIKQLGPDTPAINTGVYYFRKGLYWAKDWYELALEARDGFISDEVSLQIMLPTIPYKLLGSEWNHSCKYGVNPENAIIWHFHGRKHCRPGLPFGGDKWMAELMAAIEENDCGIADWLPGQDRMLRRYFRRNPIPKAVKEKARAAVPPPPLDIEVCAPKEAFTPPPGMKNMNSKDHRVLRHGRDRLRGSRIGFEIQTPPLLFNRDGHNMWLGDTYRGCQAFLICGGPSLKQMPLDLLSTRGVLTYTLNNAVSVVRSNIWSCVDDPGHFVEAVWRDPAIMKLIPMDHMDKRFNMRDERGQLAPSKEHVGDMPNVFGFRRNENFVPEQYLWESTVNWGNYSKWKDPDGYTGARSIMLAAVRLLYYLGIRTVYLLGCDFKMEVGAQNYAFAQDRTAGSVKGNNYTYSVLNKRFDRLKPIFDEEGYRIFNCTPNSGLKSFPYKDFSEAIADATAKIPSVMQTAGMYESSANKKPKQDAHMDQARK